MGGNGIYEIIEFEKIGQTKTVVDQLLIGIVTDNIDVLSLGPLCIEKFDKLFQAFLAIYGASRVVGIVEKDRLCLFCDCFFYFFYI